MCLSTRPKVCRKPEGGTTVRALKPGDRQGFRIGRVRVDGPRCGPLGRVLLDDVARERREIDRVEFARRHEARPGWTPRRPGSAGPRHRPRIESTGTARCAPAWECYARRSGPADGTPTRFLPTLPAPRPRPACPPARSSRWAASSAPPAGCPAPPARSARRAGSARQRRSRSPNSETQPQLGQASRGRPPSSRRTVAVPHSGQ